MKTKMLDSESGKIFCEPIIRSLAAYYFYLALGFCSLLLFMFLLIILQDSKNFISWYNTPKYYDPEHPIRYLVSVFPDMVITIALFFILTFSIGYTTTCFFSKNSSCINWKKLTASGYSHGLLFAISVILFLAFLPIGGVVISIELILYALLASLSPLLLLYLNRSIGKKAYGSHCVNRFVLCSVFTLVAMISVIYFYFLIIPTSLMLITSFGFKSITIILIHSLLFLPFTVYLTSRFVTAVTYRLSSSGIDINKRNITIIFLLICATCYLVFNPLGPLKNTPFLGAFAIVLIPLAIHHLSKRSNNPRIQKIFCLY